MKAIINAQVLHKGLKSVATAISANTVLPILTSVKLDFADNKVKISATDLQIEICVTVECEMKKPFTIVMEHKDLLRACDKLKGPITISLEHGDILIVADNSNFKFAHTVDIEGFHVMKPGDFDHELEVDGEFIFAFQCASECRHSEPMLINMNAPCLSIKTKSIDIVGTDANIMYKNTIKHKSKKETRVMVPPKFVDAIKPFGQGATMFVSDEYIQSRSGNTVVTAKLFESKYIDYDPLFAREIDFNFKCNRQELIDAIDTADVAADRATHTCKIMFESPSYVKMVSNDSDYGRAGDVRMKCDSTVDFEAIAVSAPWFSKMLKMLSGSEVELAFKSATTSIFMRPEGDPNTICLVQPLMINA